MSKEKEKFIHFVPFEGHTFKQMFSEKNSFFEEGESENPFNQLLKELEDKDFVAIGKKELSVLSTEAMLLIIYFGQIDYEIMNKYKNALNVYVAFEPDCVDSAHKEKRLKRMRKYFDYILTWNDSLVDGNSFIKFNFPIDFSIRKTRTSYEDRKLITNISANKKTNHAEELYSERFRAIKYFNENEKSFEFYGPGWKEEGFNGYRGSTPSKKSTLSNYRFSLCFENQKKLNGYITEKIWDCLLCGTIPIYWGAENIAEYIPKSCFIDFRDYSNIESLHKALISMKKHEWEAYIINIESFLENAKDGPFSATFLSRTIEGILNKKKRTKLNLWRIIYLRFILNIYKIENVYHSYGVCGIFRKFIERSKIKQRRSLKDR